MSTFDLGTSKKRWCFPMQQRDLKAGEPNLAFIIGGIMLNLLFFFDVYTFFEKEAIAAKLLAAGSSILLLALLIPFWIQVFKTFKQVH